MQVPANWDDPAGASITFAVRRIVRPGSRGQLWLLAGGPGQAGSGYAGLEPYFDQIAPGFDLYMPDHRGTGDSSYVRCANLTAPSGVTDCVEKMGATWGDASPYFNITQAARDVGEIIARTRLPDDTVFVLGVSYGTTWGHRYLQLFPDQADGIVLDSPCPIGTCITTPFHPQVGESIVRDLFRLCGEDAVCSSKLGPDPWARFAALLDAVDAGHCSTALLSRAVVGGRVLALLGNPLKRGYAPAVVYRLERCEPADLSALARLEATPYERQTEDIAGAVRFHIILSEMFNDPAPTVAEAREQLADLLLPFDEPLYFAQARPLWPVYPRDGYAGAYASTDTPLLILTGTLDPSTPPAIAAPFGAAYQGPQQHYVPVERATHNVLYDACGASLIRAFLAEPTAPLDTSCATTTPPVDFDGTPEDNLHFLGTPDAFENPSG
jgi:pimeloyl-ACP methyl ester carboxylesterase